MRHSNDPEMTSPLDETAIRTAESVKKRRKPDKLTAKRSIENRKIDGDGAKRLLSKIAEVAVILGTLAAVITFAIDKWPPAQQSAMCCYVLDQNDQPVKGAEAVGNDRGALSPLSNYGRFEVLSSWQKGSHLYVFGPVTADGTRHILGSGILGKDGDEWAPIHIFQPLGQISVNEVKKLGGQP